jgi:hypothetical protein
MIEFLTGLSIRMLIVVFCVLIVEIIYRIINRTKSIKTKKL